MNDDPGMLNSPENDYDPAKEASKYVLQGEFDSVTDHLVKKRRLTAFSISRYITELATSEAMGHIRSQASEWVGEATKECYGVAAMTPRDLTDAVKSVVCGNDYSEKGVRVTQEEGRLVIELHIAVSYGLNISTAARSISHRVKDEVEQATGLKVARVIVSVDDVIA